jgi:hypothetical protein
MPKKTKYAAIMAPVAAHTKLRRFCKKRKLKMGHVAADAIRAYIKAYK